MTTRFNVSRWKTESFCPAGCGGIVCHDHGDKPPLCGQCRQQFITPHAAWYGHGWIALEPERPARHPAEAMMLEMQEREPGTPADCTCGTRGLHTADCPAREATAENAFQAQYRQGFERRMSEIDDAVSYGLGFMESRTRGVRHAAIDEVMKTSDTKLDLVDQIRDHLARLEALLAEEEGGTCR